MTAVGERQEASSVLFTPVAERLAWSSLGFQAALKGLRPCEYACLPAQGDKPPRSHATHRSLSDFDCVFISVAWELELLPLVKALLLSRIEPSRRKRPPTQPLLVAGGPLTLANPYALSGICDAVFVGEADEHFRDLRCALDKATSRDDALQRLAQVPGAFVPSVQGEGAELSGTMRAPPACLPVVTVDASKPNVFGNAFLVEVGRGCPRACTFCIVRKSVRPPVFVPAERILQKIPQGTRRVGLVGPAVSEHPEIVGILSNLVSRGVEVTMSSVRADRVTRDFARLLAQGGLRTLTVALDGGSEALRRALRKGLREYHVLRCATLARDAGIRDMRLYMMVGLPEEDDDDLAEAARLIVSLSKIMHVAVSVSPFVPKRNTPLTGARFAGVRELKRRIALFKRFVRGAAPITLTSPRVAEREWLLAHAGGDEALEMVLRWLG